MKYNDRVYKSYDDYENEDGTWSYIYCDEDSLAVRVIVDEDDNILSESLTGDCGCQGCRE